MVTNLSASWSGLVINWPPRRGSKISTGHKYLWAGIWWLAQLYWKQQCPVASLATSLPALCFGLISAAHHHPRCRLLRNVDCESPPFPNIILPFEKRSVHLWLCAHKAQHGPCTPLALFVPQLPQRVLGTFSFQSLLPVRPAPAWACGGGGCCRLLSLLAAAAGATAPSVPGRDSLFSFKTMCESLLCRNSSLSKFKDDWSRFLSRGGLRTTEGWMELDLSLPRS